MKNFQKNNSLIVVTSYPDPVNGIRDLNAVAWHAKKILESLAKTRKVIVLAEKIKNNQEDKKNENLEVLRVWKKYHPLSLISIIFYALKYPETKDFLFQFEFNIFGGILPVLFLPLIVTILKLLKKNVYFEVHQVITNIASLDEHINIKNKIIQQIFAFGIICFYKIIGILADKIIVLEEELKQRLQGIVNINKIEVIPLFSETKEVIDNKLAKQKLNLPKDNFVVLLFGFVNWYKGSDWIAQIFEQIGDKKITLIIGGGKNPTLKDKKYYQNLYQKISLIAQKNTNIILTDFIEDDQVSIYFSAADLVIFPYRVMMSTSGPLSLAISYKKPVIFSRNLVSYIKTNGFAKAIVKAKLTKDELFFYLGKESFLNFLDKAINDKKYYYKLKKFSSNLLKNRDKKIVVNKYLKALNKKVVYRKMLKIAPVKKISLLFRSIFFL